MASAEQRLRMDALAIGQVLVDRRWRHHGTPGPLVTHDDPEPPGLGLAQAGGEHRDGGVVGMQHSPARTWRAIASARGASRNSAWPIHSARVARSSSTPSRA